MKAIAFRRIQRELAKRARVAHREKDQRLLRFVALSTQSPANAYRMDFRVFYQKQRGRSAHCRHHCFVSGRAHSVYQQFRMTRNMVRELAHRGQIYGLRKASWLDKLPPDPNTPPIGSLEPQALSNSPQRNHAPSPS
jgi:small subunit ribosomal protein S14